MQLAYGPRRSSRRPAVPQICHLVGPGLRARLMVVVAHTDATAWCCAARRRSMEFRSRFDTWWERVRDKPEVRRVRCLSALPRTPCPVSHGRASSSHYPPVHSRQSYHQTPSPRLHPWALIDILCTGNDHMLMTDDVCSCCGALRYSPAGAGRGLQPRHRLGARPPVGRRRPGAQDGGGDAAHGRSHGRPRCAPHTPACTTAAATPQEPCHSAAHTSPATCS